MIAENRAAPAVFTPMLAPESAVAEKQVAAAAPTAAKCCDGNSESDNNGYPWVC